MKLVGDVRYPILGVFVDLFASIGQALVGEQRDQVDVVFRAVGGQKGDHIFLGFDRNFFGRRTAAHVSIHYNCPNMSDFVCFVRGLGLCLKC